MFCHCQIETYSSEMLELKIFYYTIFPIRIFKRIIDNFLLNTLNFIPNQVEHSLCPKRRLEENLVILLDFLEDYKH